MKGEISGFKPEDEPVSYEQALEAARVLYDAKALNPYEGEYEDPVLQAAWDRVQKWEVGQGLHIARDYTPEKASNIVRAAKIWLSVGYDKTEFIKGALEYLQEEHTIADREGGDEETLQVIQAAIDELENRLEPQERISATIEKKIVAAREEVESGNKIVAVGKLYDILTRKDFGKKISTDLRRELIDLMNQTSREAGLPVNESFK